MVKNNENRAEFKIIKQVKSSYQVYGESIGTLSMSNYFVKNDASIDVFAEDLENHPEIEAVGVVNNEGLIEGIVVRRELFDILGKHFGRDLYKNKSISSLTTNVSSHRYNKNIISVAKKIYKEDTNQSKINYYLLVDDEQKFYGIFSNLSVMIHLSTQMQDDIELARKLQENIVKEISEFSNDYFTFAASSKMAKGAGGDYYSLRKIGHDKYLISVCDVSGKGVSASLVSSIIGGMLDIFDFKKGTGVFISKLNDYITNTFMLEKMVTGLFIEFAASSGKITVYDMGHCMGSGNLYILRDNKFGLVKLKEHNIPLGIKPHLDVKGNKLQLKKGDRIFAITDGVTDQRNNEGMEYGIEKAAYIVKKTAKESVIKTIKKINDDVTDFRDSQPLFDDITMVLFEYSKGKEE